MNRRKRALNDLDRDIREHLEQEIDDNIGRGMSHEEARRQALLKFGNVAWVKEETRSVWVAAWIDALRADLRYAVRQIRRSPALSTIIVLILAIGIGTGTAVFSEIHDLRWKTLPVREPETLRWILWRSEDPGFRIRGNSYALTPGHDSSFSYPAYRSLRDRGRSFTNLVAFEGLRTLNVGIGQIGCNADDVLSSPQHVIFPQLREFPSKRELVNGWRVRRRGSRWGRGTRLHRHRHGGGRCRRAARDERE